MLRAILFLVCLAGTYAIVTFLFGLRALYANEVIGNFAWVYLAVSLLVTTLVLLAAIKFSPTTWIAVSAWGTIVIATMPYRIEISRLFGLLFDRNAEISGLFAGLPHFLGAALDGLFYLALTFLLFLITGFMLIGAKRAQRGASSPVSRFAA